MVTWWPRAVPGGWAYAIPSGPVRRGFLWSDDHPRDFRAKIEPNVTNLAASQSRVVSGLAGTGSVSLESANHPGFYLHQKNNEVWMERGDGTAAFGNDAGFYRRAGLADTDSGVSFESYSGAGRYLRHFDHPLYTQPADTAPAREDATF